MVIINDQNLMLFWIKTFKFIYVKHVNKHWSLIWKYKLNQ